MATLVSLHAHPDDEAIVTGGTLAKASADGHRVVVVVATRGERGEIPEGLLAPGESLAERRTLETLAASEALGVHRVEFLGYVDSGMAGDAANDDPEAFCRADVAEAAARLARILEQEHADVLLGYDEIGGYGHPDHIQVHRVARRAGEIAGIPRVYDATFEQEYVSDLFARADELGLQMPEQATPTTFGIPAERVTTRVDVTGFLDVKRAAMAAHASQIAETSFFLAMPPGAFAAVWGTEFFSRVGAPPGTSETELFDGL